MSPLRGDRSNRQDWQQSIYSLDSSVSASFFSPLSRRSNGSPLSGFVGAGESQPVVAHVPHGGGRAQHGFSGCTEGPGPSQREGNWHPVAYASFLNRFDYTYSEGPLVQQSWIISSLRLAGWLGGAVLHLIALFNLTPDL